MLLSVVSSWFIDNFATQSASPAWNGDFPLSTNRMAAFTLPGKYAILCLHIPLRSACAPRQREVK
jgi:hypothetical protein